MKLFTFLCCQISLYTLGPGSQFQTSTENFPLLAQTQIFKLRLPLIWNFFPSSTLFSFGGIAFSWLLRDIHYLSCLISHGVLFTLLYSVSCFLVPRLQTSTDSLLLQTCHFFPRFYLPPVEITPHYPDLSVWNIAFIVSFFGLRTHRNCILLDVSNPIELDCHSRSFAIGLILLIKIVFQISCYRLVSGCPRCISQCHTFAQIISARDTHFLILFQHNSFPCFLTFTLTLKPSIHAMLSSRFSYVLSLYLFFTILLHSYSFLKENCLQGKLL